MPLHLRPWIVLPVQAAAIWPVWIWWASRFDQWLAPLACVIVLLLQILRAGWAGEPRLFRPAAPAAWLAVYAAAVVIGLPPLVAALAASGSIAATLSQLLHRRTFSLSVLGLVWLALPIGASVDFFLGFPLRILSGQIASAILWPFGASLEGTALTAGSLVVSVDTPCSGVKMLWQALFLVCAVAFLQKLSNRQTLLYAMAAVVTVVLANAARAATLFCTETGVVHAPGWVHEGAGLLCFAAGLALLCYLAAHFRPVPAVSEASRAESLSILAIGCLLAAVAPGYAAHSPGRLDLGIQASAGSFPGWPESIEGYALSPLALTEREQAFTRDFPGKVARFSAGHGAECIVRWVDRPTRALHSSAECLQAAGYTIVPAPQERDGHGRLWSRFEARHASLGTLQVRELIYDGDGRTWPDSSAWFWAATLGQTQGPWWAVTIADVDNKRGNGMARVSTEPGELYAQSGR